jgi:dihydrofolate reductase
MKISLIVACGLKNEIGANGDLLWHLPADMAYFKETTMGHHVLMGRITYESIPKKFRPLSGRENIVISSNVTLTDENIHCFHSVEAGIEHAKNNGEKELFIIGGAKIYEQTMKLADKIYMTKVNEMFGNADAYFPSFTTHEWTLNSSRLQIKNEDNKYDLYFEVWDKMKKRI